MKYLWVWICWQRRTRQNNLWVDEPQSSFMDVDESIWLWSVCFSAHIFDLNECRRHCCLDSFKQLWLPHLCEWCVCVHTQACRFYPKPKEEPVKPVWPGRFCFQRKHNLQANVSNGECEKLHSEMQKILQFWQRLGWGLVCSKEEKVNDAASTQLKSWLILVKGLWNMADTLKWNTSILLNSKAQTGHPVFKWPTILAERKDPKPGGQISLNEFAALCE